MTYEHETFSCDSEDQLNSINILKNIMNLKVIIFIVGSFAVSSKLQDFLNFQNIIDLNII